MPLVSDYGLLELFTVSALSSVLPIPTEPTIVLLLEVRENLALILAVLLIGSVIGASIGYTLGRYGVRKIIPFHNPEREKRAREWFTRYGAALLFISPWIPFLGDLIPIAAGFEEYGVRRFISVISVAKFVKGAAIIYILSFFTPQLARLLEYAHL
jgi:membrane protein YqaA with SNARE-associated domain